MKNKTVLIYVDGERVLIPLESIYIPKFEKENGNENKTDLPGNSDGDVERVYVEGLHADPPELHHDGAIV